MGIFFYYEKKIKTPDSYELIHPSRHFIQTFEFIYEYKCSRIYSNQTRGIGSRLTKLMISPLRNIVTQAFPYQKLMAAPFSYSDLERAQMTKVKG